MVVGADQVPVLARDLAGVDPATPYGTAADRGGRPPITTSSATTRCAAGTCRHRARCAGPVVVAARRTAPTGTGTRAYALGGYHVGLRYDGAETAEVLDRLFAGARVNDRRVPDNYSIALGGHEDHEGCGLRRAR